MIVAVPHPEGTSENSKTALMMALRKKGELRGVTSTFTKPYGLYGLRYELPFAPLGLMMQP
jgi:hypothetical protein